MPSPSLSGEHVHVEGDTSQFVVFVDSEPVLRCAARRDALRYAVLVRQAIRRAEKFRGNGSSAKAPAPRRRIRN